ncbi:MAG: CDP-alcohol phosphatidyltransferase family protein [Methanosarcina sp.]|uniref:CDP-alcohol phosphatidyltransferase family protein n=1 Tax=Methanosarcina sp. TaxID=2213 RepID=UPI002637147F|nr:CDP-alcohol phosphatidyltransferase family protein [Methanosarcina sp.]MDD3246916.1 CDP-alcohol phosphatidyltransferase family protein [Methanosarcina sp.]
MVIPFARSIPLSPNTLTLMGFAVSVAAGAAFALGKSFEGGLLILFSGVFDALDGGVARAKGRITPFGGVLDSVCDRYSDGLMFLGIMAGAINGRLSFTPVLGIDGWLWAGFALIGSFLVSYTRARAESAGCRKLSIGIAERTERMLILALGALSGFLGWALVLIAIFSHITIIQRVLRAKSILSKLSESEFQKP